jgi:Flp pilus assembly protein CpaB
MAHTSQKAGRPVDWQKALALIVLLALAAGGAWSLHRRAEAPVEVPVLARDLPAYTPITQQDLKSMMKAPGALPARAVRKAGDLIGRYTRERLSAGQVVARDQVVPREAAALSRVQGTVAVALAATAAMAFGGRLRPGEEVAVWTLLPPPGQEQAQSRRLLDRVLVLDVLPVAPEAAAQGDSARFVIVLAIPVQRQAEVLAAAAQQAISLTRVP